MIVTARVIAAVRIVVISLVFRSSPPERKCDEDQSSLLATASMMVTAQVTAAVRMVVISLAFINIPPEKCKINVIGAKEYGTVNYNS